MSAIAAMAAEPVARELAKENRELVAALKDSRPYVLSFARFNEDKRAALILTEIDTALAKAEGRS